MDAKTGLEYCLTEFIKTGKTCGAHDWRYEGYADKLANEVTPLTRIGGLKNKLRYILARYTNFFLVR